MKHELYSISSLGEGALSMMPRPSPLLLSECVNFLKSCKIDWVLCLQGEREVEAQYLREEEALCLSAGLRFTHFPIADLSVPDTDEFSALISSLHIEVQRGAHLAVHCRAGIGRSGLVACALLIEWGMSAEEAIALVSARRGERVPETDVQIQFLNDFESTRDRKRAP